MWQEPKQFFDLVLLDLGMPIMDGYEACSRIQDIFSQDKIFSYVEKEGKCDSSSQLRELYSYCAPLVISCSCNAVTPEIRAKTKEAGFTDSYMSPLRGKGIEEILALLRLRNKEAKRARAKFFRTHTMNDGPKIEEEEKKEEE